MDAQLFEPFPVAAADIHTDAGRVRSSLAPYVAPLPRSARHIGTLSTPSRARSRPRSPAHMRTDQPGPGFQIGAVSEFLLRRAAEQTELGRAALNVYGYVDAFVQVMPEGAGSTDQMDDQSARELAALPVRPGDGHRPGTPIGDMLHQADSYKAVIENRRDIVAG